MQDSLKLPLISVIVPVYNVQKYLERCVDSILEQTYSNIEVILIDDGSKDNSPSICDQYKIKDKRINVIHQINHGLSSARNAGIAISNGEYITFIDSDDYISKDYINILYSCLISTHSDISCCCYIRKPVDETRNDHLIEKSSAFNNVEILNNKECVKKMVTKEKYYLTLVTAWGKLFKANIVKKVLFPVGRKHEDEATTAKYYYFAKHIVICNDILYFYSINPLSITETKSNDINEDVIWCLHDRSTFFKDKNSQLFKIASSRYFCYLLRDCYKNNDRCDDYIKKIRYRDLTFKCKILLLLYRHFRKIYYFYLSCKAK